MSCINCEALNSEYECSVCSTAYCSTKCRKIHWPKHKALCIASDADKTIDWPEKVGYLDKYEFTESLGAGAYGDVWGISRLSDGSKWALKVMYVHEDLKNDVTRLKLLSDGSRVDKACSIHVVCYYEHGKTYTADGTPMWFIRTNFIRGQTMLTLQYDNITRVNVMTQLLESALEAYTYIHSFDVIHKDVKPENLMVETRFETGLAYRVVLVDFGLSCKNECKWAGGSPVWLPPEILGGTNSNDKPSDIFSLGASFFYLIFGENEEERARVINNMYKLPKADYDWVLPWIFEDDWRPDSPRFDKDEHKMAMRRLETFTSPSRNAYAKILMKMLSYDKAQRPRAEAALKELKGGFV